MTFDRDHIDTDARTFLDAIGHVFAVFDTQDSGNVSYGVEVHGRRSFVKTAGDPADRAPVLDHAARVALLRNAVDVANSCSHRCLPALHRVIESPVGPLLVYAWLPGVLVGKTHRVPAWVLDEIFDVHRVLADAGWIASDFYDGCLIFDFAAQQLGIVDLDNYRRGPFTNTMGRMFGSTRFMAPEEFERGATIDERTTVFTLGRTALVLWPDIPPAALEVATRACAVDRADRYPSVAAFCAAWSAACGS